MRVVLVAVVVIAVVEARSRLECHIRQGSSNTRQWVAMADFSLPFAGTDISVAVALALQVDRVRDNGRRPVRTLLRASPELVYVFVLAMDDLRLSS
jgi:hypothetical protein